MSLEFGLFQVSIIHLHSLSADRVSFAVNKRVGGWCMDGECEHAIGTSISGQRSQYGPSPSPPENAASHIQYLLASADNLKILIHRISTD
jgi:hypothetical protein